MPPLSNQLILSFQPPQAICNNFTCNNFQIITHEIITDLFRMEKSKNLKQLRELLGLTQVELGKLVLSKYLQGTSLNKSQFQIGVHFLSTEAVGVVQTQRFIKE